MELPFCSPGLRNAMNIFISFIGAGILGLPYAFKKAGLFEGNYYQTVILRFFLKKIVVPS